MFYFAFFAAYPCALSSLGPLVKATNSKNPAITVTLEHTDKCPSCTIEIARPAKFCNRCGLELTLPGSPAHSKINITKALSYPIARANVVNTLVLPGLALVAVLSVDSLLLAKFPGLLGGLADNKIPLVLLAVWVPILLGYGWHLIDYLLKRGYDAVAPNWTLEELWPFWCDGLKVMPWIVITVTMICFATVAVRSELEHKVSTTIARSMSSSELYRDYITDFVYTEILDPDDPLVIRLQKASAERGTLSIPEKFKVLCGFDDPNGFDKAGKLKPWAAKVVDARLAAQASEGRSRELRERLVHTICIVGLVAWIAITPFAFAALVQSAGSRALMQGKCSLLNFQRTTILARRCYSRALLVTLFAFGFLPLCITCIMESLLRDLHSALRPILGSSLIIVSVIASFHLIAQAHYNNEPTREQD